MFIRTRFRLSAVLRRTSNSIWWSKLPVMYMCEQTTLRIPYIGGYYVQFVELRAHIIHNISFYWTIQGFIKFQCIIWWNVEYDHGKSRIQNILWEAGNRLGSANILYFSWRFLTFAIEDAIKHCKYQPWYTLIEQSRVFNLLITHKGTLIARFIGPTWGPTGADRTQVGLLLAPWTLLSGFAYWPELCMLLTAYNWNGICIIIC